MDWDMLGVVADWTTAAIALFAFAVAAIAAYATWKTNTAQQQQLALQLKQQKYAQASQVTFWLNGEGRNEYTQVCILNTSNLPVYAAALHVKHPHDPDTNTEPEECLWYSFVLVPNADKVKTFNLPKGIPSTSTASFVFRDSGSQWWRRGRTGELTTMTDEEFMHSGLSKLILRLAIIQDVSPK